MEANTSASRLNTRLIPVLVVLALLPSLQLAWKFRDMPHLGRQHDDAIYVICARALAEGAGYRILSVPGEPHQTKYPPVYPLYLSAAWKIQPAFPLNLGLVMALCWLLLPLFAVLSWLVFRQLGYSAHASSILAALVAVNPYSAMFAVTPLSELLACSLLFGCFLTVNARRALAAGALAGLAFLTKTAFVVTIPAALLYFAMRRQWRAAGLFLAPSLACFAGWQWWTATRRAAAHPTTLWYTDYLGFYIENFSWGELPAVLALNLNVLCGAVGGLLLYGSERTALPLIFFRLLVIACLFGVVRQARRSGLSIYHLFALCYLPVLLLWNYAPHQRFVYPIYPLLLAGLFAELAHLASLLKVAWQTRDAGQRVVAGALGVALLGLAGWVAHSAWFGLYRHVPEIFEQDRASKSAIRRAYHWIDGNLPREAKFLASDDPLLYLHTGRHAVTLHAPTRGTGETSKQHFGSMADVARRNRYDYILLTGSDFLQDLRREDRAEVRASIDRDLRSVTLYEDGKIAVRRILP